MMLAAVVDEPLNTGDILHKGGTVRLIQYYNSYPNYENAPISSRFTLDTSVRTYLGSLAG